MLPAIPCRVGPSRASAVPGEVIEHVAHLADVDGLEGEVVKMGVADVDQGHHVVVGVDVKPDARVTEQSETAIPSTSL